MKNYKDSTKRNAILLALLFAVISVFLFGYKAMHRSGSSNVTEITDAEKRVISGDIYDCNGNLIAKGTDLNGQISVEGSTSKIASFSNILGIPVGNSKNDFYIRNACGGVLYGNDDPISMLFINNPLKTTAKGNDVRLTLNGEINTKFYKSLSGNKGINSGMGLVYNYKTGEIVSMVSYPSYNLNNEDSYPIGDNGLISAKKGNGKGLNRCTQESSMPASTIKPIVDAAIFTLDPSLSETYVYCDGSTNVQYRKNKTLTITDHGHGYSDVESALSESCNIYQEELLNKVRNKGLLKKLNRFMKKWGFDGNNTKTAEGLLYYTGSLDFSTVKDSIYTMIGEGSAWTTPLMLARMYGTIANQGVMVTPYCVKSSASKVNNDLEDAVQMSKVNKSNKEEYKYTAKKVLKTSACNAVLKGLKAAVESDGTCSKLNAISKKIGTKGKVFAKTGTGDDANHTCWCVAGIRDDENPYIIVTCLNYKDNSGNGTKKAINITGSILKKLVQ